MAKAIPLDNTWGAFLIGIFVGTFLYGILTLQTYIYYLHYPKDLLYLKVVVGVVWILDTLHTVFITHMAYTYLITGFGDYTALQGNIWSFNLHVLITAHKWPAFGKTIVACISQLFLVHRCWRLDKAKFNTFLSGIILFIATIQLSFGISGSASRCCSYVNALPQSLVISTTAAAACTALTFTLSEFRQFLKYLWTVDIWLGSAAVCDILVSAAVVRSLWKSRTAIPRTNNLIMGLIVWTVNTGIITSVWATLDLALFTASKATLIHDFFNVTLAKLYANTLLATLNHRRSTNGSNANDNNTGKNISLGNVNVSHTIPGAEGDTKVEFFNPVIRK